MKYTTTAVYISLRLLLLCRPSNSLTSLQQCQTQVPLHSEIIAANTYTGCQWKCSAGYYRTVDTCRPCRTTYYGPNDDVFTCNVGWYMQPCSNVSDTRCLPCPPLSLASGQVYLPSPTSANCLSKGCRNGYAYLNATACDVCEKNFYCTQGNPPDNCPGDCTIPYAGAGSILECQGRDTTGVIASLVLFLPVTLQNPPNQSSLCPALDTFIMSRLYGSFWGCVVAFGADNTIGTLSCQYSVATCVLIGYTQWLRTFYEQHKSAIDAIVRECLQRSDLVVGVALLQINDSPANHGNTSGSLWLDKTQQQRAFQIYEKLTYTQGARGKGKKEIADMLGIMVAVSFALLLLLVCACGLLVAKIKRKNIVAHMYQRLLRRHRNAILKL